MTDFVMKKLAHFPMELLSREIKTELVKELKPMEAFALSTVNREFQSIYAEKPSKIFGSRAYSLVFRGSSVKIQSFEGSRSLTFDARLHSAFFKEITSCTHFTRIQIQEFAAATKMIEKLKSIGVVANVPTNKSGIEEYFSDFNGLVTDKVLLSLEWFSYKNNIDADFCFLKSLFQKQLKVCNEISLTIGIDQFTPLCQLLRKTHVRRVNISFVDASQSASAWQEMIVDWMVDHRLPSQHKWATINFKFDCFFDWKIFASRPEFKQSLCGLEGCLMGTTYAWNSNYTVSYRKKIDGNQDCIFSLNTADREGHLVFEYVATWLPFEV